MGRGSRRVMEDRLRLAAQARELAEQEAKQAAEIEASRKAYLAKLEAEKLAQEAIAKIKAEEAAAQADAQPAALAPGDGGWKSKMNKSAIASWLVDNEHSSSSAEALVEDHTKAQLIELAEAALAASAE